MCLLNCLNQGLELPKKGFKSIFIHNILLVFNCYRDFSQVQNIKNSLCHFLFLLFKRKLKLTIPWTFINFAIKCSIICLNESYYITSYKVLASSLEDQYILIFMQNCKYNFYEEQLVFSCVRQWNGIVYWKIYLSYNIAIYEICFLFYYQLSQLMLHMKFLCMISFLTHIWINYLHFTFLFPFYVTKLANYIMISTSIPITNTNP